MAHTRRLLLQQQPCCLLLLLSLLQLVCLLLVLVLLAAPQQGTAKLLQARRGSAAPAAAAVPQQQSREVPSSLSFVSAAAVGRLSLDASERAAAASRQQVLQPAAAAAAAAACRLRRSVKASVAALGLSQQDDEATDDLLLLQHSGDDTAAAAAASRGSSSSSSSSDQDFDGYPEDEEEGPPELSPVGVAAAAAAAAEDNEADFAAAGEMDETAAAAAHAAADTPEAVAEASDAAAPAAEVEPHRKDWLSAAPSAAKAAQRAALKALKRRREASSSSSSSIISSTISSTSSSSSSSSSSGLVETEAERNEREGLPPPHAKTIDQLPVKALSIGGETILYRQALESTPMFIDPQTFERLKAQWADDPEELKRLQREDKAEYGISPEVPDEDWIPIQRDLPKGRLVVSHGLIPVNTTTAEAGYDYVETYYDPKRDYTWSYKRYNPYKQAGEGTDTEEPTGVSPQYRLDSDSARRYYLKEYSPPDRERDDGIFRQATLAEEMIAGMRRSPEGEEQWEFIPEAPFGQLAPQQNFSRSITARDFAWLQQLIDSRRKRQAERETEAAHSSTEARRLPEAHLKQTHAQSADSEGATAAAPAASAAAAGPRVKETTAATATAAAAAAETAESSHGSVSAGPHKEQSKTDEDSVFEPVQIGEAGELVPPPPPLPQANPVQMSVEEVYHRQYRHVALPVSTGCASPKVFLPKGQLPPLPVASGPPPPWTVCYRQLGQTDLYVSEIGLGTMLMGGPLGAPPAGQGNFDSPGDLLSYAVDGWGLNFIDTAELYPLPACPESYGKAEETLGRAREPCQSLKAQIIEAAEGSLRRLGLSYVDLLQLHWPQRYVPSQATGDAQDVLFDIPTAKAAETEAHIHLMEEQLDAVEQLLKDGKIRAWGLSNETPYGLLRFCQLAKRRGLSPPASCQVHYNLLLRNDVEKQFVEASRPQNTGVSLLAYGALAGGLLTGKYLEWLEPPTAGRLLRFPSYMTRLRGSMAAKAVGEYLRLARRFEQPNLTTVALKFVYSRPFITSTIIGFSDYYQLRENLHCLHPAAGAMTDWMEREINFIHWKWRDPLKLIQ